jgi:starvation-inducible DNA-binding protein
MSKKSKALALISSSDLQIGLKINARAKVAAELGALLASNYLLTLKTQNYHWNVTGAHFHSLHGMFDAQYTELAAANDTLAERIRALGFPAPATFHEYGKLTLLREDDAPLTSAEAMVAALLADHETMARHFRELIKTADDAGDDVSNDLAVERTDYHDKTAWMLRATLA